MQVPWAVVGWGVCLIIIGVLAIFALRGGLEFILGVSDIEPLATTTISQLEGITIGKEY